MRHSHGTLVMQNLLAGEYNLTLEAFNSFGTADRSPVVCPFRVPAEGEVVNHTQVRGMDGRSVGKTVGRTVARSVTRSVSNCPSLPTL